MTALLDGDWQNAIFTGTWTKTTDTAEIVAPATGTTLARVGDAGNDEINAAIETAAAAQPAWAATSPVERADLFRRAVTILDASVDEFVDWQVREIGSTPDKARFEVGFARDELVNAAAMPFEAPGVILPDIAHRHSYAVRVPHGVVGVISPFNMPLILSSRAVAPALAVGNAVVQKPNSASVVSGGFLMARVLAEAGLPAGLLVVLAGSNAGPALVAHPKVPMVHFTGSTAAGRAAGEAGGKALKKTSLSMGGNNAFIVCGDANVDTAASSGAYGSFFFAGQSCMAPGRHFVHQQVADAYIDRLTELAGKLTVGDPATATVDIGPMIRESEAQRVRSWVEEAVAAGATLHTPIDQHGAFHSPTVISGVRESMKLYEQETFGPVAAITVVADDDEAVTRANDTDYGLSAAIHTTDPTRGRQLAERLHTGTVHINDPSVMDYAYVPWGGVGYSGNGGRYGRHANWEEYTAWKWTTIRDVAVEQPFTEGR